MNNNNKKPSQKGQLVKKISNKIIEAHEALLRAEKLAVRAEKSGCNLEAYEALWKYMNKKNELHELEEEFKELE